MKNIAVEFIGTLFFMYVIIATGNPLAIGAALALAAYLGGPISGGNFNPAVTIMMVLANKQKRETLIPYILVQVAAAVVALEIYKRVY
jgi:aquaporin Z